MEGDRTMTDAPESLPRLSDPPWVDIPPQICEKLWAAGLVTPGQVAESSVVALEKTAGISNRQARRVRAAIPWRNPKPPRVLVRAMPVSKIERRLMREQLRAACREVFAVDGIGMLEAILRDEFQPLHQRLRALDLLAKYGLGTQPDADRDGLTTEEATSLLGALAKATEPYVDEDDLPRIGQTWMALVRERFPELARHLESS